MVLDAATGLVQGLANSPLGNLPDLMMRREQLQFQRESNEMRKEDREYRKQTLADIAPFIDSGDLQGAADIAMKRGDLDLAASLRSEQQHDKQSASSEMILAQQGQQNLATRVNMITGGDLRNIINDPSRKAHLDRYIKDNPKKVAEFANLGKGRQPVGVSIATDPNTGEPRITFDVYNEKTGTVGPATQNATNASNDPVISMGFDDAQAMLNAYMPETQQPEYAYHPQELPDGSVVLYDRNGLGPNKKLPVSDQFQYKVSIVNDDLDRMYGGPPGVLGNLGDLSIARANVQNIAIRAMELNPALRADGLTARIISVLSRDNMQVVQDFKNAPTPEALAASEEALIYLFAGVRKPKKAQVTVKPIMKSQENKNKSTMPVREGATSKQPSLADVWEGH